MKGQTMYYVIKFYLNHYRASRSRYESRKLRRISSKIARFRSFFLFVRPLLKRVGPFINLFPSRYISTYYLKHSTAYGFWQVVSGTIPITPHDSGFWPILAPSLRLCRPFGSGVGLYFYLILLTDIHTTEIKRIRVYGFKNSVQGTLRSTP